MKLFYGEIFPEILIHEDEQQHILKVLRIKSGEEIFVTDGQGNLAKGHLRIEGKRAALDVVEIEKEYPAFAPKLHIAIAPTKNIDRIEFFVEKAVEMGISEITFLNTDNTERRNINIDNLRKQAIGASKQSLRRHFPVVNDLVKFKDFIKDIDVETTYVAHCVETLERIPIQDIGAQEKITVLIGPEGDFSEQEIQVLIDRGVRAVTLGNQRLRTETAGIYVAAWNYYQMK